MKDDLFYTVVCHAGMVSMYRTASTWTFLVKRGTPQIISKIGWLSLESDQQPGSLQYKKAAPKEPKWFSIPIFHTTYLSSCSAITLQAFRLLFHLPISNGRLQPITCPHPPPLPNLLVPKEKTKRANCMLLRLKLPPGIILGGPNIMRNLRGVHLLVMTSFMPPEKQK